MASLNFLYNLLLAFMLIIAIGYLLFCIRNSSQR
jgi:hypothetical protein